VVRFVRIFLLAEQIRQVDIGKVNVGIGVVHRGKLANPETTLPSTISSASEIRNGVSYEMKKGDAVIIPAGTGHLSTRIDDHITYLMVRVDHDKVTPHETLADSMADLATDRP
jgi:hypothetical protein